MWRYTQLTCRYTCRRPFQKHPVCQPPLWRWRHCRIKKNQTPVVHLTYPTFIIHSQTRRSSPCLLWVRARPDHSPYGWLLHPRTIFTVLAIMRCENGRKKGNILGVYSNWGGKSSWATFKELFFVSPVSQNSPVFPHSLDCPRWWMSCLDVRKSWSV